MDTSRRRVGNSSDWPRTWEWLDKGVKLDRPIEPKCNRVEIAAELGTGAAWKADDARWSARLFQSMCAEVEEASSPHARIVARHKLKELAIHLKGVRVAAQQVNIHIASPCILQTAT
jgi:hypothetical protein